MNDYKTFIKNLAEQNKYAVFFNSSPEHASLVMGTMFEKASKIVNLYCGSFSGHISERRDYVVGLEKYLRKGGKLNILLQKTKFNIDKEPEIFNTLRFFSIINPAQITIKIHPFKVNKSDSVDNEIHFMVADEKMYRIEEDINEFTAVGNFNDPETATNLSKIFNDIASSKEAIPLSL